MAAAPRAACTGEAGQLDRLRAQPTRSSPYQNDVAVRDGVAGPAVQHPVSGGADQSGSGRLFPRQMGGFGQHLVFLHARELAERTVIRVISVDPRRRRDHRVLATAYPRVIPLPPPRVRDNVIADLHARNIRADRVHNP